MNPSLSFPGWTVIDVEHVASTNDGAAREPEWTVVRARRQSAGRGRQNRRWVSSEGGLWMSAVVPAPVGEGSVAVAPLVAGLAFARALRGMGVRGMRLRWPNDLMVDERKLGGILAERPAAERIVIGLGLNVKNDPEREDPSLMGQTVSLERLGLGEVGLEELSMALLEELRQVHAVWVRLGFVALLPQFEGWWGPSRQVRVTVDRSTVTGRFLGIDAAGNPRIENGAGEVQVLYGPLVWQLSEILTVTSNPPMDSPL
ncbi:MAG: biotin--[acetyl-CoA-carboxylase] ligase [Verrucomicrobiia bacterium]